MMGVLAQVLAKMLASGGLVPLDNSRARGGATSAFNGTDSPAPAYIRFYRYEAPVDANS